MSLVDDESFLGYCEIHSRTERALFNGGQIRRLLELADLPVPRDIRDSSWLTMRSCVADPLIYTARERLRAVKTTARDELLSAGFVEGAPE